MPYYFALRPRLAASLRRMANRLDPEQPANPRDAVAWGMQYIVTRYGS